MDKPDTSLTMSHTYANTVPAAFAQSVANYPDRPALIGEDGTSLSYSELDQQRWQAARALMALGVNHGDRVSIWAQNCTEWVIAGLAIHSIGAVLVPINTRMKGQEAGYALQKSGAKVLFCPGDFLDQHYPTLLGEHRPGCVEEIIVMRDAQEGDTAWQAFLDKGNGVSMDGATARAAAVTSQDIMDIMFTSGTTGLPKGVVTQHGQNLRVIADWCERMAMVPEDRYLVANPFFHAFGYKVGWLGGLLEGCAVMPHAVFDAGQIINRIGSEKVSVLPGPPTLFYSLLNDPSAKDCDTSSLRATITGAAAVPPSLIEQIRSDLGFDIVLTGYGLTETCGIVALCDPDDDAETIVSTCGKPIPDIEVEIHDPDGKALPPGEAGEIVVRGYNVMQGYFNDEAATADTIDSDGWLHTGDVGLTDERGYLKITDRIKDLYICGGFNCYPAEIERMMAAHPAISQVAIIGVPDERMGEVGKAFVVPKSGEAINAEEIISWCREQMANYKVPRYIETIDALPVNAGGKVMKFKLREA
ncbi:MAG: FadD3 family acyl-CoA ligase [Salinisphaeraceae bacterium]|nr:FadD3 family acyl-CoA ligase [Salinisphaeraceae bacterium]